MSERTDLREYLKLKYAGDCKCGHCSLVPDAVIQRAASEIDCLRLVLARYMDAYPAFRIKPTGAPGSPARLEQENLMALEDLARAALGAQS